MKNRIKEVPLQLHKIPLAKRMMNVGIMDGGPDRVLGPYGNIHGVWKDQPCYIIGGGKSLNLIINNAGWEFFDGKHTIGINHTIEDYDRFEWFFFLDKRFLDKTSYDLKNFKGRIFARNTTGLYSDQNTTIFKTTNSRVSTKIEDGLYSGNLSGLAALNLAILTGANPIYLCGFGMMPEDTAQSYHYKPNYTAEDKSAARLVKFTRVQKYYSNFATWKKIIKNIGATLPPFETVSFSSVLESQGEKSKPAVEVLGREPIIAHISFSNQAEKHGDITRHIINRCYGRHSIHRYDSIPKADLYIIENFISTRESLKTFPHKKRAINLVHTTNCWDAGPFLSTIALTNTWQARLREHGIESKVIKGGIDLSEYKDSPDYTKSIFGRITRWSPGKIPPWWSDFVREMLAKNPKSSCLMYVDFVNKRPAHPAMDRLTYDQSVKIHEYKGQYLKNMSVYVHANGSFRETMSHAVIEAMATGLPIVYLREGGVIAEVVGNAGVGCRNQSELQRELHAILNNQGLREQLGKRSLEQAKNYNVDVMIKNWDQEIKSCLGKLV